MKALLDGKQNGEGIQWPFGKRIAVMLTFDFDAEFLRISRAKSKGTVIGFSDFSRGQYGPHEGIWRCLQVLDTFGVKGTFFVPGRVIEEYKEPVKAIHSAGHEIGYHGYAHEAQRGISKEEETLLMEKSEALIYGITGKKPVGHRAPESILHPFTPELLRERGYLYSSSRMDCDFAYRHQFQGRDTSLVELPLDVLMDDFTYYYFTFSDPAVRAMYQNEEVLHAWKAEFDSLAKEGDKIFILKLHPQLIGRASRAVMLGQLIGYMQQRGAWIAPCEEVARFVLEERVGGGV